jgi:hypothetical protein
MDSRSGFSAITIHPGYGSQTTCDQEDQPTLVVGPVGCPHSAEISASPEKYVQQRATSRVNSR